MLCLTLRLHHVTAESFKRNVFLGESMRRLRIKDDTRSSLSLLRHTAFQGQLRTRTRYHCQKKMSLIREVNYSKQHYILIHTYYRYLHFTIVTSPRCIRHLPITIMHLHGEQWAKPIMNLLVPPDGGQWYADSLCVPPTTEPPYLPKSIILYEQANKATTFAIHTRRML